MRSAVLKPLGQFIAKPTLKYPSKSMGLSLRQAAAIVASAAANGITLKDEAAIPRSVVVDGVAGLVENGVSCDLLTSGTIQLISAGDPAHEIFKLSKCGAEAVVALVGKGRCSDLGVI
jgi:hypothetical protein